jgi:hypothetical protein
VAQTLRSDSRNGRSLGIPLIDCATGSARAHVSVTTRRAFASGSGRRSSAAHLTAPHRVSRSASIEASGSEMPVAPPTSASLYKSL